MATLKLGVFVGIGSVLGAGAGYLLHDVITGWGIGAGLGALSAVALFKLQTRSR